MILAIRLAAAAASKLQSGIASSPRPPSSSATSIYRASSSFLGAGPAIESSSGSFFIYEEPFRVIVMDVFVSPSFQFGSFFISRQVARLCMSKVEEGQRGSVGWWASIDELNLILDENIRILRE